MEFMSIPDTYYDNLREKLKSAKITVAEDISVVRGHHRSKHKTIQYNIGHVVL